MDQTRLKVLLVEDDENDYVLIRSLLSDILTARYELEWASSYEAFLETINRGENYDVYMIDYRLGARDGLEILRELKQNGCRTPIIFLTGYESYDLDIEAMRAGASDFLSKNALSARLIERCLRYAVDRKQAEEALRDSERKLRSLSSKLLTAQEEERKRIAGEIHDSLGSSLSAIKFSIENIICRVEYESPLAESLNSLALLTQRTIEDARRIMCDLRPSILDDLGLLPTINWFSRQFQMAFPAICIEHRIDAREEDVPEALKIVIFRLVQEALHNIAKHSKAKTVTLALTSEPEGIELIIEDNGVGFALNAAPGASKGTKGMGLASMEERTRLAGGAFSIKSIPKEGTAVRALWPAS